MDVYAPRTDMQPVFTQHQSLKIYVERQPGFGRCREIEDFRLAIVVTCSHLVHIMLLKSARVCHWELETTKQTAIFSSPFLIQLTDD